jgi:putative SOS response-associated peptidase YedK
MCSYYQNTAAYKQLKDHFELLDMMEALEGYEAHVYPKYKTLTVQEGRKPVLMSWGFKHPHMEKRFVHNCRCESAATSPMFKHQFAKTRCLIPATGFTEYNSTKHKFLITLPASPIFAFAGLYNSLGECTMITTVPNPFMEKIHNRMPVIIPKRDYDRWLIEGGTELLVPYDGELKAVCIAEPKPKPEKKPTSKPVASNQPELF